MQTYNIFHTQKALTMFTFYATTVIEQKAPAESERSVKNSCGDKVQAKLQTAVNKSYKVMDALR